MAIAVEEVDGTTVMPVEAEMQAVMVLKEDQVICLKASLTLLSLLESHKVVTD